jgi:hypothetical protein
MTEYVTKEALYDLATYYGSESTLNDPVLICVKAVNVSAIQEMPCEDVAPVVFCKDCKWRGSENCAMFYRCECGEQYTWETDDDYCSYGERGDAPKPKNYAPQGQEDNWA